MIHTRRLLDRLTAWSPILLLGGLAALTYWLDAQVQTKPPRPDGSSRHDEDLYVENFRAVSFAPDGQVSQSLSAKRAQHYPDDNTTELVSPAVVLTEPGRPRFSALADRAKVSGDRETIELFGNVRAVRDAPADAKGAEPDGQITVLTEYLRVLPKLGRAETSKPVTIEESRGIIHAVGMVLDTEAKTLKLKSGVRGTLQPAPPKN
jgi:lipopolysaccharide export system protein LptC